jgi:hypothetical protein
MAATSSVGAGERSDRSPSSPGAGSARGRRRRTLSLALLCEVGAVVAFLGVGALGAAPWSPYMPHFDPASSGNAVSFSAARSAAEAAAVGYDNAAWVPVGASGIAVTTGFTVPSPWAMNGSMYPTPVYGCGLLPASSSVAGSLAIPASSASVGSGLSPAWIFDFRDAAGGTLLVVVLSGHASLFAVESGTSCGTSYYPTALNISSGVVDSPQAASVVNAWGGSAYLQNNSGAAAVYSIEAASPYFGGGCYPGCYGGGPVLPPGAYSGPMIPANNSSGQGGAPSVNCTSCSIPPPPSIAAQYLPPTWAVSYAPGSLFTGASYAPSTTLSATLDAQNGTLLMLTVVTGALYGYGGAGYGGCCPPSGYYGPSSPSSSPPLSTGTGSAGVSGGSSVSGPVPAPSSFGGAPSSADPTPSAASSDPIALGPVTGPLLVIGVLAGLGAAIALTWRARARPPAPPVGPSGSAGAPTRPLDDVM